MNYNIILYQKPLGISIPEEDIKEMKDFNPHFVCFPEYFFVDQTLGNHKQTKENQDYQINRIKFISEVLNTVVIGGTMLEVVEDRLYNTTFVFQNGQMLGSYRKKHLFFAEEGIITPGKEFRVFNAYGITFGVLICADVFHDESFLFMNDQHAEIIFSPTFSLKKQETVNEKFKRDNDIYVRGAGLADAIIVKVCGVQSEYKSFLQARSLIASKKEVLYRVRPDQEDVSLIIKQIISL